MAALRYRCAPDPPTAADRTLLLLHGWGANAADLLPLASVLAPTYQAYAADAPFPHPYVTEGRMWYDLSQHDGASESLLLDDRATDLATSEAMLSKWFEELPIDLSRTILAGFSQGGALTLSLGLQFPFAGLIVFSGYLVRPPTPRSPCPPVLMIHGTADPVVPFAIAQASYRHLAAANVPVRFHPLPMGHEINPAAIALAQSFIACH
ncbi:dienelactone hydrolase family protein [Synechococcus sp. PCC 6716]|nr:dienelactone hydrolase family protein [Synechococcus sp. PCC 6716]